MSPWETIDKSKIRHEKRMFFVLIRTYSEFSLFVKKNDVQQQDDVFISGKISQIRTSCSKEVEKKKNTATKK